MPIPVVLVSKEKIGRSEFMQFIKTCCAEIYDDGIYDGYLYNNDAGVVWVMYNPEE